MGVFVVGDEAGDARADRHPFIGVPVPRHGWHFDARLSLDDGATRPAGGDEIVRQIDFRQPARQPQPTVVGHDAHFAPAGSQQGADAFNQQFHLFADARGQLALLRMAELVQLAAFGPRLAIRIASGVGIEELHAGGIEQLAETIRCERLLGFAHIRMEVLADGAACDLVRHWRARRLRRCSDAGQRRPSR